MPLIKKQNFTFGQIGIWHLSEQVEILEQELFNELCNEDKEKYDKFKSDSRKKEWLAARILLKELKKSPFAITITYNDACKPVIADENISISHSRDYVAIILSSKKQVAIDIEKVSSKTRKIIHKFLSENEQENFNIEDEKITSLLWSAKESVYKYFSKKNLPFIDGIKILPAKIENKGELNAILLNETTLTVNYEFIEDNVLTYIC